MIKIHVLKFWIRDELSTYCSRTRRFNVRLYCYKLSFWIEKKRAYLLGLIRIEGDKSNKEKFIEDLKKDKNLNRIVRYKDNFIALTSLPIKESERLLQSVYFNPELIYISPVIVDKDAKEYWEVASFRKKPIELFKKVNEKLFRDYEGEILEFSKKEISNNWIFQILDLWKSWDKIKSSFLTGSSKTSKFRRR